MFRDNVLNDKVLFQTGSFDVQREYSLNKYI